MKECFYTFCTLLIKATLFFAISLLGLLVSLRLLDNVPWLLHFGDFVVSFIVSLFLGVLYFFIGENRKLTLIFTGFIYIVYMCTFVNTFQDLNTLATSSALARCFLGIINMAFFLITIAILFGNRLGIIPNKIKEWFYEIHF